MDQTEEIREDPRCRDWRNNKEIFFPVRLQQLSAFPPPETITSFSVDIGNRARAAEQCKRELRPTFKLRHCLFRRRHER